MAKSSLRLIVFLCLVSFIAVLIAAIPNERGVGFVLAQSPITGGGIEGDPYLIASADDWNSFALWYNAGADGAASVEVKLSSDISFSSNFVQIGTSTKPFSGRFDGNNKILYGINHSSANDAVGVFGVISAIGRVENLGIGKGLITSTAGGAIGGLAGVNKGYIFKCFSALDVTVGLSTSGAVYYAEAGGLVGINDGGVITSSFSSSNLLTNGREGLTYYSGGLVGYARNSAVIEYSYAIGRTEGYGYVGGVLGGRESNCTVTYCFYNTDATPQAFAIAKEMQDINLSSNKVMGLKDYEFGNFSLQDLAFNATAARGVWLKPTSEAIVLNTDRAAAFYSPSLKDFELAAIEEFIAIRRYGLVDNGSGVWGSINNPYVLSTAKQLNALQTAVNINSRSYQGCYFILANDIDLTDYPNFTPIGNNSTSFSGNLDGNNYTISNLKVELINQDESGNNAGLFGRIDGCEIKNIRFDETCRIRGRNNVGTVAGFARDTKFINIETKATLLGITNIGGIVGNASSGSIANTLSQVKLTVTSGASSAYGLVGGGNIIVNRSWYFTVFDSGFLNNGPGGIGGGTLIQDVNGVITAEKDNSGSIQFSCVSTEKGYSVCYQNSSGAVIAEGGSYTPGASSSESITVWARFVKPLTITIDAGAEAWFRVNQSLQQTHNYYYNQRATLYIKVDSGYGINGIYAYDTEGNSVEFRRNSYVYEEYLSDDSGIFVTVLFDVLEDTSIIYVDVYNMNIVSIADRYYDGTSHDHKCSGDGTDGFLYEYNYGGLTPTVAPIDARTDYKLIIFLRKDGEVRGKAVLMFNILKAPLIITEDALRLYKEYDGLVDAWVASPVKQDDPTLLSCIFERDKTLEGSLVIVSSEARFTTTEITAQGVNVTVFYRFSLSGSAAVNYEVPSQIQSNNGYIIKRTIKYTIEERALEKFYNGRVSAVTEFFPAAGFEAVSAQPVGIVTINFYKKVNDTWVYDSDRATETGVYKLEILIGNTAYYNVEFTNPDGYMFTVKPKPVEIIYTNTDLVYNQNVQSVNAGYYDVDGRFIVIASANIQYKYEDEELFDASLEKAGNYTVKVVLTGNYTPNEATAEWPVFIDRAIQPQIYFNHIGDNFIYGDQERTLSINGGSVEPSQVSFYVLEGNAVINGNNALFFTGGGKVVLRAVKAQTDNYKEIAVEIEIDVEKATLKIYLADIDIEYGDLVLPEFSFDGFVSFDSHLDAPAEFTAPTILIDGVELSLTQFYSAGVYSVSVADNALSKGYKFDYSGINNANVSMYVSQKSIRIEADDVYAVYGDDEKELTFEVYDVKSGQKMTSDRYNVIMTLFRETGKNADVYKISINEQAYTDNPDYEITYVGADYTISQRPIIVRMTGNEASGSLTYMSKKYLEADPLLSLDNFSFEGLQYNESIEFVLTSDFLTFITRTEGQNAYLSNRPDLSYGFYAYRIKEEIPVNSNYYLYNYLLDVNLRIYPRMPHLQASDVGAKVQYGDSLDKVDPNSLATADADGNFVWEMGEVIPDFSQNITLEFKALFISGDKNYLDKEIMLSVSVIPRELTVSFSGQLTHVYSGFDTKPININISNKLEGDELNEIIRYFNEDGSEAAIVKDVGKYRAMVFIQNGNYIIVGVNEVEITITKKELVIYLDDIMLPEGVVPPKDFKYEGLVGGEDDRVLDPKPDVIFFTEPGNHEVTPFGAGAKNYEITYRTSIQGVSKINLSSEIAQFSLKGNFDFHMEATLKEIKKAEAKTEYTVIEDAFKAIRSGDLSSMKLQYVVRTSYTVEDEKAEFEGVARASIELPTRLRESKNIKVLLIKDGVATEAANVERVGNTLYFDMECCDYFAIIAPPDYTWLIIIIVIVILLIAVFVLDAVSEKMGIGRHKNKPRKVKNND